MAAELKVPKLGMDMEEASILRWLVEEGAEVEKGDPVLEIDTDKVAYEVEATADGTIRGLQVEAGQTIPVGATLAFIIAPGEEPPESGDDTANTEAGDEPAAAGDGATSPASETGREARVNGSARGRVRASPAARRIAAEKGIEIQAVVGSGPNGRVYLSDVLKTDVHRQALEGRAAHEETTGCETVVGSTAPAKPPAGEATRRESLSRLRRVGAERTAKSFAEVPHFYLARELRADRLVELRERLKSKMDPPPSLTELLALAVSRTLKDHHRLNAYYVDGELEVHEHVNLGIAVATEAGLVVPVLEKADELSLRELVPAAKDAVRRAREGSLGLEDLSGGTFTISNLGMLDIDAFDAIINAPQAAILALGRVRTVPEWRDGEWLPLRVISATLSVDHRAADGADGAHFLADLQSALEDWELLL